MKIIKEKLSKITPNEKNIRNHPEKQVNEMIKSLKMFGQIRPLVVDENNIVWAGNGLYLAMKELNWESASILRLSNLDERTKKKLMVADNKLFDLGNNNYSMLMGAIEEISLEGDFDIPGYDSEILKSMFSNDEEIQKELESYGKIDEEHKVRMENTDTKEDSKFSDKGDIVLTNKNIKIKKVNGQTTPYIICPDCGKEICL
jgi:hypothetical protein